MGLFKKEKESYDGALFNKSYMGFRTVVFSDKIIFNNGLKTTILIDKISGVSIMPLFKSVAIETTGGKNITLATSDKKGLHAAIVQAIELNAASKNHSNAHNDADEIERFAILRDKGIITDAEFVAKKKQILES